MAMTSLKQPGDSEAFGEYTPMLYGYGTEICLNGEQTEAMGISKMAAGQQVTIKAVGIVTRSTEALESADDSGGKDLSICIQLTDMSVSSDGAASVARAVKILYGE